MTKKPITQDLYIIVAGTTGMRSFIGHWLLGEIDKNLDLSSSGLPILTQLSFISLHPERNRLLRTPRSRNKFFDDFYDEIEHLRIKKTLTPSYFCNKISLDKKDLKFQLGAFAFSTVICEFIEALEAIK